MANFNKAFNFRGGFQVDTDVLVVRGQAVGIGSSVPTQRLDVDGIVKAKGLEITSEQSVGIESASVGFLSATTIEVGITTITSGIISANTGIVTYYGDGRFLEGLPTSQWIDIDVGLGYTSIYASGNVGVDTTDPRYAFQVGGVPFPTTLGPSLPAQDGVGIEDGAIYASGIITTRGDVVALGTVYAQTEFVGVGSNITILNADNIAIGSIGSMRYGDIITTKEVYADRFIGTATSSEDLEPTASINIDTVRANTIDAVGAFISTEGKIRIGDSVDTPNNGDIQVKKTGFTNSTIFSIAEGGSSRMFVGTATPAPSTSAYGGIKFGGNTPSDISNFDDLDVVNYDEGHLNFYINGGQALNSSGEFRWIEGRNNTVLATLNRGGLFKIEAPNVPGDPSLEVVGVSTLTDVYITGALTVEGATSLGNISISELTSETIGVGTVDVSREVIVGSNPVSGGTGVALRSNGILNVSDEVRVGSDLTPAVRLRDNGDIDMTGDLNGADAIRGNSLDVDSISVTNEITSTTYSITASGDINATSLTVSDITATGSVSLGDIDIDSINLTSSISGTNLDFDSGSIDSLSVVDLTVTQLNSPLDLPAGSSSLGSFDISGNVTADGATFTSALNVNTISAQSGSTITLTDDVSIGGDITLTGSNPSINGLTALILDSLGVGAIDLSSGYLEISGLAEPTSSGDFSIRFRVDEPAGELQILVFNDGVGGDTPANEIGTITLPFD